MVEVSAPLLFGYALCALAAGGWAAARALRARRRGALVAGAFAAGAAGIAALVFAAMVGGLCGLDCERVVQPPRILVVGLAGSVAGGVALALPSDAAGRVPARAAGALALGFGLWFAWYFLREMAAMGL